ncbi:GSCFA domain-containing protein [Kordiimonas aestuarii]|uniref:GSCFA domain-containing protein n=1 Tax=Kordiimonas aestuarii TaxID=1005925 RepID=UPI0021CFE4EA|nr:GSCFA domain-containing protein [Kordiimonas aestuarii]
MSFEPDPGMLTPAATMLAPDRDISLAFHHSSFDRLAPLCSPETRPKFQIDGRKPIFVFGSCFALEVASRLRDMGSEVADFNFLMTADEWHSIPQVIVNKFTPAGIHNEVSWCHGILTRGNGFREADTDDLLYDIGNGYVIDGGLMGFRPIRRDRAIERRKALFEYFSKVFEVETVVITLGLIESWWDSKRRRFLEEAPRDNRLLQLYGDQFHFCKLDYDRCRAYLLDIFRLIDSIGKPKKILITTSPVPIARTFTDDDIIVANSHGKSVLRAVCGDLVARLPNVAYFPSYESVVLTRDWSVYALDRRHVARKDVARIIAKVIETYFTNVPEPQQKLIASVLAFHNGALDRALELAKEAVSLRPSSLEAWHQLAQCHDSMGAYGEAAVAFERVAGLAPENALSIQMMAIGHCKAGTADRAIDRVEGFLARYPGTPVVEYAHMQCLHALGRFDECMSLIRRLEDLRILRAEGYTVASQIHQARGDLPAALNAAQKAASMSWQSADTLERVVDLEMLMRDVARREG